MINIVVVDDHRHFLDITYKAIKEYLEKNGISHKLFKFNEYGKEFNKLAESKIANRIYFMDIECSGKNGINVAKKIRLKDKMSHIVFISAYQDNYYKSLLDNSMKMHSFINKQHDFIEKLESKLQEIVNELTSDILTYRYKDVDYSININQIKYIEKIKDSRNSYLYLNSNDKIVTNKSFFELENLNGYFLKVHRSNIVNMKRVKMVDYKKKTIIFDDNTYTEIISKRRLDDIRKYFVMEPLDD